MDLKNCFLCYDELIGVSRESHDTRHILEDFPLQVQNKMGDLYNYMVRYFVFADKQTTLSYYTLYTYNTLSYSFYAFMNLYSDAFRFKLILNRISLVPELLHPRKWTF